MLKITIAGWKKKSIFLAVFLSIVAFAVFGDKGLLEVYNLRSERDGILAYNASVEEENRALEEEIRLLKADKRYIARIARKELGMIGKNEVIYRFEAPVQTPSRQH